ncbi:MAG: T9SS type A sorting domain-containing protein [Flavobacteriales bacterium]|nr:T9SS type A sorting domain-containing protein [Flavobacteriales bacterium]
MDKITRWFGLFQCILVSYSANIRAQNWQSVDTGLSLNPRVMYSDGLELYVGTEVYNNSHNPISKWNGMEWDSIDNGCGMGPVLAITKFNGNLIAAGSCDIQYWNGSAWSLLGGGSNSAVLGMGIFEDDLIAVGWFDTIGSVAASRVARWDGQQWSAIDTTKWGVSATACAIEYQGDLYIGGNMHNTELDIDRIARWDGSQWHKVGNGIRGGIASVNCFEIYQGYLFVGGRFFAGNGNPGPNIARWNGQEWLDVGGGIYEPGGLGCDVRDMVVFEGELYAVGTCQQAGGVDALYVAKWDGEEWCGFGDVFDNTIGAITVHQGELYIGGGFRTINNDTILRVAKWVGDDFTDRCGTLSVVEEVETNSTELTIYPNPTNSATTLTWQGQSHGNYQLHLYDASGRQLTPSVIAQEAGKLEIDMSNLAQGIYFGQLFIGEAIRSFTVVKQDL